MMLRVFRMELEGLQQLNEDDFLTDPNKRFRINITQYLQDIYRFFKLSPYKKEFEDIFTGKLDIYNSHFFRLSCDTEEAESGLADYFFSKDFYEDALILYLRMLKNKPDDAQLYEKTAYCYQENGDYEQALRFYKKADLIDRKAWTVKKIGLCYRRLNNNEKALEYYIQAGNMEPENLHTTMMIGHCYLDLRQYENALKYYFRIEYKDPGNLKILRPIAYCFLALGRFEDSEKYYDLLSAGKLNAHDMINMGHLALARGRKKEAIELYRKSILTGEINKEKFIAVFSEDRNQLISLGVNADDLPILLDYLLFILE
ncbi:MAG: tetratricopeptide repeat protein [Bacteroidales bacterium]|nr:tetratricopeptide repeat protein [Bacteroidales bacterium]